MKNKRLSIILLAIIVLIAAFLRLFALGTIPSSPNWDEVALGYNAYSILQTGKDEYGKFLPIILRSYDDYKPALYAYLIIPFIKLFGLHTFVVRLPSALLGICSTVATFFIIEELFRNKRQGTYLALLAAFLLAISPWHIQFSRIGFESNAGLGINILAVLFFLKGLRKPPCLYLAAILAALNLYMYQSDKVFTPLLALSLIIIFRKQLLELSKKNIIIAFLCGLIIAMPMVYATFTNKEALARAKGVSAFSERSLVERSAVRFKESKEKKDILGMVLNNRRVDYLKAAVSGYLVHYDLNWLFITGDLARHHAPNMGLLYLWELPFLLCGIYFLLFGEWDRKTKYTIFAWFLIAPIPASITSGVPHAVRTLNFLPTFQIFVALGILFVFLSIRSKPLLARGLLLSVIGIVLFLNIFYYINQYFVQLNYVTSQDWQYGYKEAVEEVQKIGKGKRQIVVSNEPYMDQSYMFFLFYLKYDPISYQQETSSLSGGFRETHAFGKYEFRPIKWDREQKNNSVLYVGRASDFPSGAQVKKIIYFVDGQEAIKIVEGSL